MNHARVIVRVIERVTELTRPGSDLVRLKDLLLFLGAQVGKRFAIDVFHRNAAGAFVVHEIVNPDDMRMSQFQAALRLMFKLIQQRTILDHKVGEEFQCDIALQFFVVRQPHNSHSAPAKYLDQLVTVKDLLSAGSIQRCLKKATRAASLRRVGWDFGSALLTNSDYRGHFGSRSCAPLSSAYLLLRDLRNEVLKLLMRNILPEVTPDKTSKLIKSDSPSYRSY